MPRVNLRAILADPAKRERMLRGAGEFLCALEHPDGHVIDRAHDEAIVIDRERFKCQCEENSHVDACQCATEYVRQTTYGPFRLCRWCYQRGHMEA